MRKSVGNFAAMLAMAFLTLGTPAVGSDCVEKYNPATQTLHIPCVDAGTGGLLWADLKLTGSAPVTFELTASGSGGTVLQLPPAGKLYHGVFPGDDPSVANAEEDGVSLGTVESYEKAVGRKVMWVYFSHNWYKGRAFPQSTAAWIRDHGSVPFIRLMLRSSADQNVAEPLYVLNRIVAGDFDEDLRKWGQDAADFATALIVEFGTEVNGDWFSWNGAWNGGATVGPERFRNAFRHIVATISAQGTTNITWVFHVAEDDSPDQSWNRFENYYPGDDVVDWVGVSVYGAEEPLDDEWTAFSTDMDRVYPRLTAMVPGKPLFLLEFGVTGGNPLGNAADWADAALTNLLGGRWPRLKGFSWWNEFWQNDDNPAHDTDMQVQTVPGLAAVFANGLKSDAVVDAPIFGARAER